MTGNLGGLDTAYDLVGGPRSDGRLIAARSSILIRKSQIWTGIIGFMTQQGL